MTHPYERRHAVRALLVAQPQQRVLLIQTLVPDTDTLIWLTPGGGIEAGEDPRTGLCREIREETGLQIDPHLPQGPVWQRRMKFHLHGKGWDQSEQFYTVPVDLFEPDNSANPALAERDIFRGFRWWSLAEIEAATDQIFVPLAFARHFKSILKLLDTGTVPEQPYDVGR